MFLKKFLSRVLSLDAYLRIISSLFFISYFRGLLKRKPAYEIHYFIKKLILPGNVIIDIGANLGYYAVLFGRFTGRKGHVYAVEPVSVYRKILERNIKRRNPFKNITILPFALGKEDRKQIKLGVPVGNSHFRHGLTRVIESGDDKNAVEFTELMMRPQTLFGGLTQLDYIKCDVEGYELFVIPEMMFLIERFKPVLQIETDGENRRTIADLLQPLGYSSYFVKKQKLHPLKEKENDSFGDIIFIPQERKEKVKDLIHS